MSNAISSYKNIQGLDLNLFLDIDLKTEMIQEFNFNGDLSLIYQAELLLLKNLVLNKNLENAQNLKRTSLINEKATTFGSLSLASLPLWLLHQAIDDYLGKISLINFNHDALLCFCFKVSEGDVKTILKEDQEAQIKEIIIKTHATSACHGCFKTISNFVSMMKMNPSELLILLDDLKKEWIKKEGLDQYKIEITDILGDEIWLLLPSSIDHKLESLKDYWGLNLGISFRLHPTFFFDCL